MVIHEGKAAKAYQVDEGLGSSLPSLARNIKSRPDELGAPLDHPDKGQAACLNALLLTAASRWLGAAAGKYHMPGMPVGFVMLTRTYFLCTKDIMNILGNWPIWLLRERITDSSDIPDGMFSCTCNNV